METEIITVKDEIGKAILERKKLDLQFVHRTHYIPGILKS